MSTTRQLELDAEVKRLVRTMTESYDPIKIILYGSLAAGNIHPYSDIDLVVIKNTNKPFYDRLEEVIEIVKPDVATDIIVYTPEEVDRLADDLFFQEEVIKKGKVLFSVN